MRWRSPEPEPDDLDDEVIYLAEEPGLLRRAGAVLSFLALLAFVVVGLGGYWVYSQVSPTPYGDEVTVVIPGDSGMTTIARVLEEHGVVTSDAIFRYYARLKGIGPIRPGEYDGLRRSQPMDEVIARLEAGPAPERYTDLPIPEGLWLTDTATRVTEAFPQMDDAELAVALSTVRSVHQPEGRPLDGFLFPATYRVGEKDGADERALVEQMVRKFDEVAEELGLADAPAKLRGEAGDQELTPYDVLKVASYIEAEAKVPEDRSRIARVIYNRLREGMPLGIDATVLVALGEHKDTLTQSELQVDSPYNLRRHKGFTPTPINSPGVESLRAALNPSTEPNAGDWLYYVLIDEQGHHSFSQTRAEHDRKVAAARRAGVL